MSTPRPRQLTGAQKAAVFMMALGEDTAATIFRHLPDKQVQSITRELAEMSRITPEVAEEVLTEYEQMATTQDYVASGGMEYASQLLVKAFGEDAARLLLEKVRQAQILRVSKLDSLQKVDPQQLAKFLEEEHPQAIALILAHLDAKQASTLLMKLPERIRADVIKRLAHLRQFSPDIAEKVSVVLNRRLQALGEQSRRTYSGFKGVADVLNGLDPDGARSILQSIEQDDPQLAIDIRNLMFTFEDFISVPERSLRDLLAAIDKKTLAMCLKGASEDLKNHVYRTMSTRAVDIMKEDMEALGPVRGKDVAKAQKEAVDIARKLESEGKLTLKTESEDEYVL